MKTFWELRENKSHPKYKDALKQHKAGVWDGNVDKDGNPIVHINGKAVVVENTGELVKFMVITFDYSDDWPDYGKPRSEFEEIKREWDNDRSELRFMLKKAGAIITDSQTPKTNTQKKGMLVIGTRGGDAVMNKLNEKAVRKMMRKEDIFNLSDNMIKINHSTLGYDIRL